MSSDYNRSRPEEWLGAIWMLLLRVALTVALLYALYRVGFIVVIVLVSVMLAFTVAPLVDWFARSRPLRALPNHTRRVISAGIVFLLLAAGLVQLCVLIIGPLVEEVREFAGNMAQHRQEFDQRLEWLNKQWMNLPPGLREWLEKQEFKAAGEGAAKQVEQIIHRTLESGMLIVEMILIPVLAFSFLTESRPLKREFASLLPRHRLRDGLYFLKQTGIILQSYAVGQLILALIAGIVVWILLTILGIHYAVALAVVAAVTRVIPVIGPLLGGIPIVLLATLQSWERGLIVLVVFTVMHLVESKIVMPRIIGYRINLHPAVVIIVLLIGAEFFGMWGMFLAAPVAAVIKVLIYHFFVRPRKLTARPAPAGALTRKEAEVERAAVAGAGSHSGAH